MFSPRYRRYVLGTLTAVYTINYLDRGLMILLLQPIQDDLHISDTQLGLVTGIAFALFYATLGIPIARWADRGDRGTITAVAIGLWGVTMTSCLFVRSFFGLVLARIAAAVGEAGCMPPTYSLLGDYFPAPAERTRAMAIYWLASPIALLISLAAGGWLNESFGWRKTFFITGIPALLVAALVKLTVREPRTAKDPLAHMSRTLPQMSSVVHALWHQPSSRNLVFGIILFWTMGLGLGPWYATFMVRSHGMSTSELGLWLGLIFGAGGIGGNLLGAYIAERIFVDDERGKMRFSAISIALIVPCFTLFLTLPNRYQALVALIPVIALFCVFLGPTFALMQRLVPNELRATTLSIVMLLANLLGMGAGPLGVGALSDWTAPFLGSDSLRYSMFAVSLVALWSAYFFWKVGETVNQDLQSVGGAAVSGRETLCEREAGEHPVV